MMFKEEFAEYLRTISLREAKFGDSDSRVRESLLSRNLIGLADFVECQHNDHPALSVLSGLWDYLEDDSVRLNFDCILRYEIAWDDKDGFLRYLARTVLDDTLYFIDEEESVRIKSKYGRIGLR